MCRQIGYRARSVYSSAHYGQGSGPIFLDNVECSGSEAQIGFCQHLGYGTHNCAHSEDVGVVCYCKFIINLKFSNYLFYICRNGSTFRLEQ